MFYVKIEGVNSPINLVGEGLMARQIKETPVLKDKNAEHFLREIEDNKNKKVLLSDYDRAIENYKKIKFSDVTG